MNPASSPSSGQQERQVLLIATGGDHPGILDEISHYAADRRARIEAIRVSNLRGRFALLMLLSGDDNSLRSLAADLHILSERTGVRATLEEPDDPDGGRSACTRFDLLCTGAPGGESEALRQVSNLLRVLKINIIDVSTQPLPPSRFALEMIIDVPREVPVPQLRELLGQLMGRVKLSWELGATDAVRLPARIEAR